MQPWPKAAGTCAWARHLCQVCNLSRFWRKPSQPFGLWRFPSHEFEKGDAKPDKPGALLALVLRHASNDGSLHAFHGFHAFRLFQIVCVW